MQSDYEAKILIVEDESETLSLLNGVLGMLFPKATLFSARDGREGLQVFKEHEPDVVLADLNLPEIGGAELTQEVRFTKPETRIIVMTGESNHQEMMASTGRTAAADHYVVKPVNLRELRDLILNTNPGSP